MTLYRKRPSGGQPRELQERILHFALPRSRQPALAHLREQPGQQTWGLTPRR